MKRRDFLKVSLGGITLALPFRNLKAGAVSNESVLDFIRSEIAAGNFPGSGLLVYQNGKLLMEDYQGTYCDGQTRDARMGADVVNRLFSFSKGISATIVVMAHQKGLIDYDAPLATYIPSYRGGWKDGTTIRHLLTHTAGIPNCELGTVLTEETWQRALEVCAACTVEWEPGSRSVYHARSAMFLAAEAVRSRIPGRPSWESICREWLFEPLGADSLTFALPTKGPLALTPQPKKLPTTIAQQKSNLGQPGSGCFGRLSDVIKVLQLHLNGGTWDGKVLINPEAWAEMHRIQYRSEILQAQTRKETAAYEPFGLGWKLKLNQTGDWFGLGNRTAEGAFGHAGIDTVIGVGIPQKNLAIAFATTGSPPKPHVSRIRNTITDMVADLSS
jgi:CubicO group peptidase (beta-lactamase class C family)